MKGKEIREGVEISETNKAMKIKIVAGTLLLIVWVLLTFLVLMRMPQLAGQHVGASGVASPPKINVVVTIPILKDLVVKTCGQYVNVTSLIKDEIEVLDFQQKPRDAVTVYQANLLIKVGAGLDDWVDRITRDLDRPNLQVIDLSKSVGLLDKSGQHIGGVPAAIAGRADPYFWLDPGNVRQMILAIHLGIIGVMPEAAKYLELERQAYFAELDKLESDMATELADASAVKMVAGCDGLFYFAKRFNLSIVGRLDQMVPRIAEPHATGRLAETLSANRVRIIVLDTLSEQLFAQQLSELGPFKIALLSSAVGGGKLSEGYLVLMRHNAQNLAAAVEALGSRESQKPTGAP